MDKEELIKAWEKFAENNDFMLNTDRAFIEKVADGVLMNEKNLGMKYCPCRLKSGEFDKDLELLCPCNFKIQDCWQERGECWCGLFVKRK
ncbi:hypothetical protein KY312_03440 [Candidatus Woesearchaeota archaeon]|nr:hypothetical protein [Candidatus Woesearchaeota archaeon]